MLGLLLLCRRHTAVEGDFLYSNEYLTLKYLTMGLTIIEYIIQWNTITGSLDQDHSVSDELGILVHHHVRLPLEGGPHLVNPKRGPGSPNLKPESL